MITKICSSHFLKWLIVQCTLCLDNSVLSSIAAKSSTPYVCHTPPPTNIVIERNFIVGKTKYFSCSSSLMASASVFGIATLVDFLYDSLYLPTSLLLRRGAGIFVIDVHCMDSINKTKIKQYKQHIYNLILHRIPSMMSGSSKSLSSFVARECARHSFEKKTSKGAKAHLEAALESISTPRMSLSLTVG